MNQLPWLAALKQGDEVVCDFGRYGRSNLLIGRVVKRLGGGGVDVSFGGSNLYRFGKHGNSGSGFNAVYLQEATPDILKEARRLARRRDVLSRLKETDWDARTTEQLERVLAALDERDGKSRKKPDA